jgi:hypothetical protein
MTLTILVCRHQKTRFPKCQVCGVEHTILRLHHILRRSLINKHEIVDLMPLPFHALICDRCNMNQGPFVVDNPEGRAIMLAANAEIFGGIDAIIQAFQEWDAIAPNGHNDEIVNLERVLEIYASSKQTD